MMGCYRGLVSQLVYDNGLWGIIVTHNNRDTCLPLSIMGWDRIGVFHGSDGDGSKKEVSKPEMLGHFWDSATPIYMGQVVNFDPHHNCSLKVGLTMHMEPVLSEGVASMVPCQTEYLPGELHDS